MKRVEDITIDDFLTISPIWTFSSSNTSGDMLLKPITRRHVKSFDNSIILAKAILHCGNEIDATIGNIDSENNRITNHFAILSVWKNEAWFHLARYHDSDYHARGPKQLAKHLELSLSEVFPIKWTAIPKIYSRPEQINGVIKETPDEILTREELIQLAVP
jgi:hypothetical protein